MNARLRSVLTVLLSLAFVLSEAACRPEAQGDAEPGPIAPSSYQMLNGQDLSGTGLFDDLYDGAGDPATPLAPLMGGLGELTDGERPEGSSFGEPQPWVGWGNVEPRIGFRFDGPVRISTIRMHFDRGGNSRSYADEPAELEFRVGEDVFVVDPEEASGTGPVTVEVAGLALEGEALEVVLKRKPTRHWIMLGEVEFEGIRLAPPAEPTPMDVAHKVTDAVLDDLLNNRPQEVTVDFDAGLIQQQADILVAQQGLDYETDEVRLVKAEGFAQLRQQVLAELAHPGIEVVLEYENLPSAVLHVDGRDALLELLLRPEVVRAYEDEEFGSQLSTSLPQIGQDQVVMPGSLFTDYPGYTGAGTTVAVLDTGADYTHSDLGSCTDVGQPAGCRVVEAVDIREDGQLDDNGHGTNVAAIVAGVAPGTELVVVDVFRDDSARGGDITFAIDWLIRNRSRWQNLVAVNMSLGSVKGTFNGCDKFDSQFAELRRAGILPVVSSGNDSLTDGIGTPACSKWAVSVGRVDSTDTVGADSNSRFGLDLLAPGTNIVAGGGMWTGTSQAAPHVAGALAILRERFPDESIDELVVALQSSGVPVRDWRNDLVTPRIQLDSAVQFEFVPDRMEAEDRFGDSLATGDFDGDGFEDLAVGVPGEDDETGKVHVFYGTVSGLSNARNISRDGDHLTWGDDLTGGEIGSAQSMDWFGTALAAGDFDGDGYDDLAIGVPGEDVAEIPEFDPSGSVTSDTYYQAGAVKVFYGTGAGLSSQRHQNLTRFSPGVAGNLAHGAFFGETLAAGDVNLDGYVDLAVGAPGDAVNGQPGAGSLSVIMGGPSGLTGYGGRLVHQNIAGTPGNAEAHDAYASALAMGDIDGDGYDDIVVGIPQEDIGSVSDAGYVNVIYGSAAGAVGRYGEFHQDLAGVVGDAEAGDLLGWAVAVGDFDGDGYDDVAAGMPGEEYDGEDLAGQVMVIPGSPSGLAVTAATTWRQGKDGVAETLEADDQFGFALVAGAFDDDPYADLVVSAPGEDESGNDAGVVHLIHGSANGLDARGVHEDELWHQDGEAMLEHNDARDQFGAALAAGDFDANGRPDLVIGIPGENPRRLCSTVCGIGVDAPDAGAVVVLYGDATAGSSGLGTDGSQLWSQDR